jgi:hypothetical protein
MSVDTRGNVTEAEIRAAELFRVKVQLDQLNKTCETDESIDFQTQVLDMLDNERLEPGTHALIHRICEAYKKGTGYDTAPDRDKFVVSIISARASLAASLDHCLSTSERETALEAAKAEIAAAEALLNGKADRELHECLAEHRDLYEGLAEGAVATAVRFDIPIVLPVSDGAYDVRMGEAIARLTVAYRPPGAARSGLALTRDMVGASGPVGGPLDWITVESTHYTSKVDLLTAKYAAVGFTTVLAMFPRFLNWYIDTKPSTFALGVSGAETHAPTMDEWRTRIDEIMADAAQGFSRRSAEITYPEFVKEPLELLNRFIDAIRVVGHRYSLDRLVPADIDAFTVVTLVRGNPFLTRPQYFPARAMEIGGTGRSPAWLDTLRERLLTGDEIPVEEILIVNARKFLLHGELRLAVINVNAALESFLSKHIVERLAGRVPDSELGEFLEGQTIFEKCKARLITMANDGVEGASNVAALFSALRFPKADKEYPPVHKLVKKMNEVVSFGLRTKELDALIKKIREYRNEVAHGKFGDTDLDAGSVRESLAALEQFMSIAMRTLAAVQPKPEKSA